MYNDEQNLYHYTYRKDGTEPGQRYDAKQPTVDEQLGSYRQQQEQQTQNSQPVYQSQPQGGQTPHKNGKNRLGLKIASLALVCALLGGLVGGGTAYLVSNSSSSNTTEVNVSNRKPTEIQLKTVDGKNPMTDAELYAANVNSVVSINITATSDPNFFGQTTQTAGAGSGFILTPDGYIVTNAHVVAGANDVRVQLSDNRIFPASLVGFSAQEDLAVLKIDVDGLTAAEFGDSNALVCGESVSALGDSLGYRGTFTDGIISALDREMTMEDGSTMVLIQTSAAINFGNSGGPLLNQYGQVVGINTIKIIADDGSAESLGFAIPSTRVKYVTDHLIAGEEVRNAAFGFTVSIVQLPEGGLELLDVDPASDAYAQGLRSQDILTSANGLPVSSIQDLVRLKQTLGPGDMVELSYLLDGTSYTIWVELMDSELFS